MTTVHPDVDPADEFLGGHDPNRLVEIDEFQGIPEHSRGAVHKKKMAWLTPPNPSHLA